jgi:cystine transport system substrate-binding protein
MKIMHIIRRGSHAASQSKRIGAFLLLSAFALASVRPAFADLQKIQQTGVLKVAVYEEFPPYSNKKEGIDVDIAEALAKKLGVKLSLLPFPADENLNDDLRNMIWKGHYLGYGPADVMLHVPYDKHLLEANPQVEIFAPYHNETVRLVRNVKNVPDFNGMDSLVGKRIGVEKVSISAMVLLGEGEGKFRDKTRIFEIATEALARLKAGELDAVLANRSEIESVLRDEPGFEMHEVNFQRLPRKGWIAAMAVKKENLELARQLQVATNELFESGEMAKIFAKHGVQIVKP